MGQNRSQIGRKYMISCIFVDLFYAQCPKPTFKQFSNYFNVFWGLVGGLLLLNSRDFSCEPHREGKETCFCVKIEYGFDYFQVQLGLVVSTAWIGSEYGFVILLDESASESHTQNSTWTAT